MIQQILETNYGIPQSGFSINAYFDRANDLAGDHPLITNIKKELKSVNTIDRNFLHNIYNNNEISFSSKILLTFWWGGLSHQFQAPLFYKKENLDSIQRFSNELESDLINSINYDEQEFKNSLGAIFNSLFQGDYKMNAISISYFTKIFQFFFYEAYEVGQIKVLPIIADKWSMRAGFAMMLEDGLDYKAIYKDPKIKSEKNIGINFSGPINEVFEQYWQFVVYFTKKAQALNEANPNMGLSPFKLEEILFGKGRDWNNLNNPRRIYSEFIFTKFLK